LVKRKTNSPWGSAYKEGLPSTAVNDRIEVDEILYPSVNTGTIDVATGQWEGVTLSEQTFGIDTIHEAVANGANVLSPQSTPDFIDMTGYSDLFIGINTTRAGNYAITAVMGPASNNFANLSPVDAAALLKGSNALQGQGDDFNSLLSDSSQSLTADVWNILYVNNSLKDQKMTQINIINNSGGEADIQFAFMRVV